MSLESATYVNQLVSTNPPFDDPKAQGDDHLRLIKSTLTVTFAGIGGVFGCTVGLTLNHTWSGTHDFTAATVMTLPNTNVSGTLDATGAMSAATPDLTSNSTRVATTAFVQSLMGGSTTDRGFRSRAFFYGGNK